MICTHTMGCYCAGRVFKTTHTSKHYSVTCLYGTLFIYDTILTYTAMYNIAGHTGVNLCKKFKIFQNFSPNF